MYQKGEKRMFSIKGFITTVLLVLVLIFPSLSRAELIRVTGIAELTYENEVTAQIKAQAITNAKLAAFKKFMSREPKSRKSVYKKLESTFRATLDTIIPEYSIQREKDNSDEKRYKVLISAAIDSEEVDRIFDDTSRETALEGEFMTFFVARVQTGQDKKVFDEKRTKISESSSVNKQRETGASSASGSVDSIEKDKFSRRATGGSRVKKTRRAKVTYVPSIPISEDIGSAIEEYLNDAGYDVAEYDDLEGGPSLRDLIKDGFFDSDGRLDRKIKSKMRKLAREEEVKYFGTGDIEIGVASEDVVSGGLKLSAFVNFRVYDLLCCKRPKTIGVVKKMLVTVTGDDESVMELKAGNRAAIAAIKSVLGKLQVRALEKR
jgi:hypothetical protein